MKDVKNEVFAIHWKGQLLHPNIWKEFSDKYGTNGLYGWRPPKKLYYKIGHAKCALSHLPEMVRNDCKIVRYVPDIVVAVIEHVEQHRKYREELKDEI